MKKNSVFKLTISVILAAVSLAGPALAKTFWVDQNHPKAADTNPGTEDAPFETIQRAVNAAEAGDTVLIKAGVYRECVLVKKSGKYGGRSRSWAYGQPIPDRIVLSAYGDDKVIIDGSDPIPRTEWEPVEGKPGVYVAAVEPQSGGITFPTRGVHLVYWKGKRLMERADTGGPKPADAASGKGDACTWYYDQKDKKLYVYLGGVDPSDEILADEQGPVEASVRPCGLSARGQQFITFRKLTVRRTGWRAIESGDVEPIIEDCHVYDCEDGLHVGCALRPIVRRCLLHDIHAWGMDAGNTQGALIYDNVVYAYAQDWTKDGKVNWSYAYRLFAAEFARFFNNIAIQPLNHANRVTRDGGFWTDCHGPGHVFIGNALYRLGSCFYVESPARANLVQWNTCLKSDCGIFLANNTSNLVVENYCADNREGLLLRGCQNVFVDVSHNTFGRNWLKNNRTGIIVESERGGKEQTRNYAQRNIYELPTEGGIAANWAGVPYKTVAEFQKATGQETLGREEKINLDNLGLVWVRVDGLDLSHEPIPMFGNPDCERLNSATDDSTYFWCRGDATGTDSYPEEWMYPPGPEPFYKMGWQLTRVGNSGAVTALGYDQPVQGTPVGGFWLFTGTLPGQAFSKRGMGWWSPSLPAVGLSTIDFSLWMRSEEVKATERDGGAVVYVEWSDWNGQNKTRSYLVGAEGGPAPTRPELNQGTSPWTEVKGSVIAPKDARRFALFLGARSCTGRVSFDEIRTLAARP